MLAPLARALVLLALAGLATAAPLSRPQHAPHAPHASRRPVRWRSQLGSDLVGGAAVLLEWEGGSGAGYEVYYIPQVPGEWEYDPDSQFVTIEQRTTATKLVWRVPDVDMYPAGTTLILGVKDAVAGRGADWYDLSHVVPLIDGASLIG